MSLVNPEDRLRPARKSSAARERPSGLLVASGGGHLLQLVHLAAGLPEADWIWVTFPTSDAEHLLAGRRVIHAHHPTNRSLRNLVRNTFLAIRLIRTHRARVVISTGAGVAVPFIWVGRVLGCRVIYVESFARTHGLSLTCRLVRPIAHRVFVQWPDAAGARGVEYHGSIF